MRRRMFSRLMYGLGCGLARRPARSLAPCLGSLRVAVFLIGVVLVSGGVMVSTEAGAQGTSQEQDACRPDVFRLCSAYIPDVDGIVSCLRGNEPRLNSLCHEVMFPTPEPVKAAPRKARRKVRRG
jgi:hypothetical protein